MKAVLTSGPEETYRYLTTNQVFDRHGEFVGGLVTIFVGTEFEVRSRNPSGYELLLTWGQPRLPTGVRIYLTDEQFARWVTPGSAVLNGYSPYYRPER